MHGQTHAPGHEEEERDEEVSEQVDGLGALQRCTARLVQPRLRLRRRRRRLLLRRGWWVDLRGQQGPRVARRGVEEDRVGSQAPLFPLPAVID